MSRSMIAAAPADLALRGATLAYLGVMVVMPLFAIGVEAARPGLSALGAAFHDPFVSQALKLTAATALMVAVADAVLGTATAWALVRHDFPGKALINALVDLPFAVPTIVSGAMLVALYGPESAVGTVLGRFGWKVVYHRPGVLLALLLVTYPFVIRSVQPVLLELERDEEEAAATLGASNRTAFFRVTLPALLPAVLTGSALAFGRALGEFGSVMVIAGNRPMETMTASLYIFGEIEGGDRHGAMALSVVLLLGSLVVLSAISVLQRREGGDHGR